jgi:hypothetical protein
MCVAQVEVYRFRLGCALHVLKPPRVLHPSYLAPVARPFDAAAVVSLAHLNDFNLRSHAEFGGFAALRELNLRGNKFPDLLSLGLQSLTGLRKLDVSLNAIRNPVSVVATFLDGFPLLRLVALRGNPFMKVSCSAVSGNVTIQISLLLQIPTIQICSLTNES